MELSDASKQALNKILETSGNALADAISGATELAKQNVGSLVKEVIFYEGYVEYGVQLVLSLFSLSLITGVTTYIARNHFEDHWGLIIPCVILGFIMFMWAICSIQTLLKVRFAPRLFLTTYATDLLKK